MSKISTKADNIINTNVNKILKYKQIILFNNILFLAHMLIFHKNKGAELNVYINR